MSRWRDDAGHHVKWVNVHFDGLSLWCVPETLEPSGRGALVPPYQITAENELIDDANPQESYAYVNERGEVKRFGEVIGQRSDLVRVKVQT